MATPPRIIAYIVFVVTLSLFSHAIEPAVKSIYHEGWIDHNKNGVCDPYENPALYIEQRIDDLLARMTLEEKTAQMVTLYGFPRVLMDQLPTLTWDTAFWKDGIGNIDEHMNGCEGHAEPLPQPDHAFPWPKHTKALNEIQRWFIEHTRLGIPVDFSNEGIRGLLHSRATSFPAAIAVGSTWNAPLVREIGRITGREAHALGYTNVYSPVLDVPRDPRWGRIVECYSEDPFLTATYGVEQIRGIQEQNIVSTVKHFAVYSIPKGARDGEARTDSQASWREVQTIFLPPFRSAIRDAGALGVMASYNDYDGVPIESSRKFLTEILREQWGFRGYVVSDSGAVEWIHTKHRTATTPAEAVRQSVEAGLNIRTHFTPPIDYADPLRELVRTGRLSIDVIDQRVREILRVKYWQGTFDHPFREPANAEKIVRAPAHMVLADRVARESIVLLKNENETLPLSQKLNRVLVAGPLADDSRAWRSRYGPQQLNFVTPLAGIRAKLGPSVEVRHARGVTIADARFPASDIYKTPPTADVLAGIDEAVAAAHDVDVIIAVLGENDDLCRESAGRTSLNLPGYQEELLQALHATGKPIILVLTNGRPLSINWADENIPAIVELWMPGENGGDALADVLFGDYNPSGRLPVTFPRSVGQIPLNFPTHPEAQGRDPGMVSSPLYPFGHGLSYTSFAYRNLVITPEKISGPHGSIEVTCDITNTGKRAGDEVVQLYLRDDYSTVITFEKVLRGFQRISLAPGETKTVRFMLTPTHLELYDENNQWVVQPGRFTVAVGASSEDIRMKGSFTVLTPEGATPIEDPVSIQKMDPR